ncbi:MAG: phage terminase large subunit [Alphaproteobacteria bacterium]|nr:phage terminase large subunit [Alphaproteobacteria bacterium]
MITLNHRKKGFLTFIKLWNDLSRFKTPQHHNQIGVWLEQIYHGLDRKGLLLAFRNSGKSTVVALFCAWILYQNPNDRILVVSADARLATKISRHIRRIIEHHPLTEKLVPKKKEEWAGCAFSIERSQKQRDPSVTAFGITSGITGARADVIICDDVEIPKNCNTEEKREDLRERLVELEFILSPNGMQIFIGTPHTYETIYQS